MLRAFTIVFLLTIRCRFHTVKLLSEITCFRYGNNVLKLIRKYEKHDYRLRKTLLGIAFLNSCLDSNVQLSSVIIYHQNGSGIVNPIDVQSICFYRMKYI